MFSDLWIIVIAEGAVWVVHDADGGHGRAVGADGWEEKEWFVQFIGDIFYGIAGTAAANTKEDVCALYFWVGDQGIAVFIGRVTTVPDEVKDLDVTVLHPCEDGVLGLGHGGLPTDDYGFFAIIACEIWDLFITICPDGVLRQSDTVTVAH